MIQTISINFSLAYLAFAHSQASTDAVVQAVRAELNQPQSDLRRAVEGFIDELLEPQRAVREDEPA